jgi:hypothetical protein
MTRYRYEISRLHPEARSWITIDGVEILTSTHWYNFPPGHTPGVPEHETRRFAAGLFDAWDLPMACEAMLTLSIDDALASPNPLIRGLALLDTRCGRRRLATIDSAADVTPVPQLLAVRSVKARNNRPAFKAM